MNRNLFRVLTIGTLALTLSFALGRTVSAQTKGEKPATAPATQPAQPQTGEKPGKGDGEKLKPIDLKLPKPAFKGTPKNAPPGTNVEKPADGPRPPFLAPPGVKNVALNKPVTSSDKEPITGSAALVTNGDKEATEGSYVELGPKRQWVQIDLREPCKLCAILVWHYHASARIYHDVVVQVADDADFITNVRTLFNNDHDNSSGLGLGSDMEYWDTFEGKLIDAQGVTARYVRLYSNGSTADDQNHYTEVEVYGLPAQ
jgi:hypothetical protein